VRLRDGEAAVPRAGLRGAEQLHEPRSIEGPRPHVQHPGLRRVAFTDAACRDQFRLPRTIPSAELDAFARCLVGLQLTRSRRVAAMGFELFASSSGIEIETRFAATPDFRYRLVWITGVHLIAADNVATLTQTIEAVKTWQLRPFTLGGNVMPVCSWLGLGRIEANEPVPIAPLDDGALEVTAREPLSGDHMLTPDDADRSRLSALGYAVLVGVVRFCVGPDGKVSHVSMYASTGLPGFDHRVLGKIKDWTFAKSARPTCTAISFRYQQNALQR
jgi:hypothetical protein